jgi:uncharacterized membrane protein
MKAIRHLPHQGNSHGHGDAKGSPDPVVHNVDEIVRLQQRDRLAMTRGERAADLITAFSGSMIFVYLHVAWFALWIALNQGWLGFRAFDPFPFGLLTMIVSLEAIFLSTFVLISQNRQALQADRRQKVNMQVDMLAEQEVTKLIHMVAEIQQHPGIHHEQDRELRKLERRTHIENLADAIDEAERAAHPKGAEGPSSAVDTEH